MHYYNPQNELWAWPALRNRNTQPLNECGWVSEYLDGWALCLCIAAFTVTGLPHLPEGRLLGAALFPVHFSTCSCAQHKGSQFSDSMKKKLPLFFHKGGEATCYILYLKAGIFFLELKLDWSLSTLKFFMVPVDLIKISVSQRRQLMTLQHLTTWKLQIKTKQKKNIRWSLKSKLCWITICQGTTGLMQILWLSWAIHWHTKFLWYERKFIVSTDVHPNTTNILRINDRLLGLEEWEKALWLRI